MVATVPKSGTPEKSSAPPPTAPRAGGDARAAARSAPDRRASARRLLAAAAAVLAVALLFLAYLQVSRTYPENSDESNDLLMAWDMLHGNVLLHGWYLSDVSFITTELPQYVLLVRLFGLHTDTAHIAAAMTYTLVVLLAVLLATGRVSRREAGPRMLLTAGLMFAPQLGVGVFVLLLSLGHIGTAVPLLLIWLVIDRGARRAGTRDRGASGVVPGSRAGAGRRRAAADLGARRRPAGAPGGRAAVGGGVRAARGPRSCPSPSGRTGGKPGWVRESLRAHWSELSLAVAAVLAQGLASVIGRLLQGPRRLRPAPGALSAGPGAYLAQARLGDRGRAARAVRGQAAGPAAALAFAVLHLAGVALVAWAMLRVARHFVSWPDMISQVLLVAMVVNVIAYVPSTLANATDLNAREFAVVLPFGAVLAGRTLAADLFAGMRGASGAGGTGWPPRSCWPATEPASATQRPSRPCPRPTHGWRRSWSPTT